MRPVLKPELAQYYGGFDVVIAEYVFAFITVLAAAVWMLVKSLWKHSTMGDHYCLSVSALIVVFVFVGSPIFNGLTRCIGLYPQLTGFALVTLLMSDAAARVLYDAERLFMFVGGVHHRGSVYLGAFQLLSRDRRRGDEHLLLREILAFIGIDFSPDLSMPDVEAYQIIAVVLTVLVVLGPVPLFSLSLGNTGRVSINQTNTAVGVGNSTTLGSVIIWDENLWWTSGNTPIEDDLTGAGNADDPESYGTYQRPAGGDYVYPEVTYGVMS